MVSLDGVPSKAPSVAPVGLTAKLREWMGYFRNHMKRTRRAGQEVAALEADLEEYDCELRRHSGISLAEARVLEIGFGTRAARLALLNARARDVLGVDPEVPMLTWDLATLRRIGASNGWERAAKTTVRYFLFDRSFKRALTETVGRDGRQLRYGRMEFCDAADLELPEASVDLVVSEDVLEHMSVESLTRMLPKLRRWLGEDGLALLRPNVFTGISGGHLAEWDTVGVVSDPFRHRHNRPWGHLLEEDIQPNTYLNRLSRQDYRDAFRGAGLKILEERPRNPDLGRPLLIPQLRDELSQWPDDELFSNQVLFVLKATADAT